MPEQFIIRIQLIELNHTRCRQANLNLTGLSESYKSADAAGQTLRPMKVTDDSVATVNQLSEKKFARILARPTLVTVSGRPASFRAGGEMFLPDRAKGPDAMHMVKFGTEVDATVKTLGNGKAMLRLHLRQICLDSEHSVRVDGVEYPEMMVAEVSVSVEGSLSG